jgi:hypothetical protein
VGRGSLLGRGKVTRVFGPGMHHACARFHSIDP